MTLRELAELKNRHNVSIQITMGRGWTLVSLYRDKEILVTETGDLEGAIQRAFNDLGRKDQAVLQSIKGVES